MDEQLYEIGYFKPGTTGIEIVGCEDSYKNLKIIKTTDACTYIKGSMNKGTKQFPDWIEINNYTISNGTVCRRVKPKVEAPFIISGQNV